MPNWPITRLKRRLGKAYSPGAQGLALAQQNANTRLLSAVDEVADANGAFCGQTAADALAIFPALKIMEAELAEDEAALASLAEWCLRFSPKVAVDSPDGLFMEIDGCAHLWGGEENLARTLMQRLAAQNIPARIAIADTFGAAWALARHAPSEIVVWTDATVKSIARLPVEALRIEPQTASKARRLGLKTIGDLMAPSRVALRKRFGAGLMLRLEQVLGEADEALVFLQTPAAWSARRVFADPISRPEDIQRIAHDLAQNLCARLDQDGLGARRFELTFHRIDGANVTREVGAALPMRNAKRLAALFVPKLQDVDPGFGVEVAELTADCVAPINAVQSDMIEAAADVRNADLAPLIDRLRNRLGTSNVWRAAPYTSHAPERAVARIGALDSPCGETWPSDQPRPIRLFHRPQPIEAMAPIPDDPPLMFRWRGIMHRVLRAEGPERISAEWWRRSWEENSIDRIRDYYRVEDESGARYWLFRAGLYDGARPARWYIHGLFA
ncbi:MAG: DNA polymerase Y family protein [Caulobacterales bacterium]